MARPLIVEILANPAEFVAGLTEAEHRTGKFESGMHGMKTAATAASLAIVGGLVYGMDKSVQAAEAAQVSQTNMESQLKQSGISWEAHSKQIGTSIAASEKLSAFNHKDLEGSFTSLVRTTGNVSTALSDMNLATDIARRTGHSLESATTLVTKAELGKAGALTKAGLAATKVTTATDALKVKLLEYNAAHGPLSVAEKIHEASLKAQAKASDLLSTKVELLTTLHKKFADGAKAYGETGAAAHEKLANAVGRLEESFGKILLPVIDIVMGKVTELADLLGAHTTTIEILIGVLGGLAVSWLTVTAATHLWTAAQTLASAATTVWSVATKIAAAGQWLLNAALSANPIGLVIAALVLLVAGVVIAYQHSETFRKIVTAAFDDVKAAALAVADFFTKQLPQAFESVLNWVKGHWPLIATLIAGPFAPLVALATNAFGIRSALTGALEAVLSFVEKWTGKVVGFIEALPGRILAALGDVGHLLYNAGAQIIQGLLDGLTSKLHEVEHLASGIAGKIASLKGPIEYDRQLLLPHGQAIIEGLHTGMQSRLDGLYTAVAGFAPTISATFATNLATPAYAAAASGGRGGGGDVHMHMHVGTMVGGNADQLARDLEEPLRRALYRLGQRNVTTGLT